ncbi:hypothetical protein PMAA_008760 [Talaromyces marneffei ATCC 18224]|uniref:Uncharacterized protein n=1 Tax=Talaromyces marneffei (strain ATCC 18224 / CBS 334.59 / QM 7333) TaxID=441960 RepID=B6QUD3_TALMQ|nr:hypothetical protein PMAA_008760 [Talaromyces marneffei ATCC 18224]
MPAMLAIVKSVAAAMPGFVAGAVPVLKNVLEFLTLVKDILDVVKGHSRRRQRHHRHRQDHQGPTTPMGLSNFSKLQSLPRALLSQWSFLLVSSQFSFWFILGEMRDERED